MKNSNGRSRGFDHGNIDELLEAVCKRLILRSKPRYFKFCTHILSIDQNNNPLKISGAVAGCVVRTLKTFKCTQ